MLFKNSYRKYSILTHHIVPFTSVPEYINNEVMENFDHNISIPKLIPDATDFVSIFCDEFYKGYLLKD